MFFHFRRKIALIIIVSLALVGAAALNEQKAHAGSTCSAGVNSLNNALKSTSSSKGTMVEFAWSNYASCLQSAGVTSATINRGDCGVLKTLIINHHRLEQASGFSSYDKVEKALFEFELCATNNKSSVLSSNLGGCSSFDRLAAMWSGQGDLSLASAAQQASSGCYARYQIGIASRPGFSGTASVGNYLTALTGTWSPGVEFSYQWLSNGSSISGANSKYYLLQESDAGTQISLRLTGTKWGYSGSAKSTTSNSVLVKAALPAQSKVPQLKMSGTIKVGKSWTCSGGVWDSGVKVSFLWYRDGVLIPGANRSSYAFTEEDLDHFVKVVITGSKVGFKDQSFSATTPSKVGLGTQVKVPKIDIFGYYRVGEELEIEPGVWDSGVSITYRWFVDDVEVPEWNRPTFTPKAEDLGKVISYQLEGAKGGYSTRSYAYELEGGVALGVQAKKPLPKLSKAYKVGQTINLTIGAWDVGSTQQITWYRDSTPISEYEGRLNYLLTTADKGHKISVKVVSSKVAYATVTKKSLASAKISR
ncbi:MAG: hypothetical protein RLZZ380_570 [Actinomycetota bacterium]